MATILSQPLRRLKHEYADTEHTQHKKHNSFVASAEDRLNTSTAHKRHNIVAHNCCCFKVLT